MSNQMAFTILLENMFIFTDTQRIKRLENVLDTFQAMGEKVADFYQSLLKRGNDEHVSICFKRKFEEGFFFKYYK